MNLAKVKVCPVALCLVVLVGTAGYAMRPGAPAAGSAVLASDEADAKEPIPAFDGVMKTEGQTPQPKGGKVILYSRNRYGNYPVATYDFTLGLRGDDLQVANYVDLVFGNAQRKDAFADEAVNSVPGAFSKRLNAAAAGAAGRDGASTPEAPDQFRVGLYGGSRHRIVDCDKVELKEVTIPDKLVEPPEDDDRLPDTVKVIAGHTYVIHLYDKTEITHQDQYVAVKVLRHQDNDAVEIEWAPLELPKRKN
jgi:hypothetical protein